ncbi:hypothetical protein BJV74DRAFT_869454 [Russula compacta]|nr:hypothetical protein BJV74DRAFT_869454 [Russula compacta]
MTTKNLCRRDHDVDPTTNARTPPIYASTFFIFNDSAHGADLFGLRAFGNTYKPWIHKHVVPTMVGSGSESKSAVKEKSCKIMQIDSRKERTQ